MKINISLCDQEKPLIDNLNVYFKLPYLNQIIVVLNSNSKNMSNIFYNSFRNQFIYKRLRIFFSLNYRFISYNLIRTDAIMSLDNSLQLNNDEIIFAFRVWRDNRER